MLFIGHFEAIATDKQFKNDHEKRNHRIRRFHDYKSSFVSCYLGRESQKTRIEIFFLRDQIYQFES
jgi:hypothetical protein